MKFSWPALQDEIDPQDLLAMEGLRLFDEAAFNWLRDNRDFLFGEGHFVMAGDEIRAAAVDILRKRIHEESRLQVLRVMSVLFPQAGKWFEERHFGEEAFVEVMKRRGVGSEAGYDAYFGLHPSADSIPKSVVDALMRNLEDVDGIERVFRSYIGKQNSRGEPMVGKLLDELRTQYRSRTPAQPTQALLDALFRVGEVIIGIDSSNGILSLAPRAQISFLIHSMLEQWGLEAGQHLVEAFEKSGSPAFCADIYVDRGRELGVFESQSSERACIAVEDFNELGEHLLPMIREAAKNETLADAPFYFDISRSWAYLGSADEAKGWLARGMIESAEFMAKAGKGLVSYSVGSKERTYTMRVIPEPALYDPAVLIEAGKKHLAGSQLSQDQRRLIAEIVRGCERIMSNEAPDPD